ncbi:cupin domain-containing protein [Granulicella sp. L60]|uniref:cupin domain-containing protein n=1 Tax=Granulicella sp. L60 TaxID=1641866 RepID=UPI00131DE782|nr:cupin domain-containing protein [Granulicella sp. L60]
MHRPIRVGNLSITFIKSRHETQGALDLFELIVPPQAFLNVPHLHRDYDETILGINGITTWTINDRRITLLPGQILEIPRGTAHSYSNLHSSAARMMCLLTPGLVGPEYFQELAAVLRAEGPPDLAGISHVMSRYGVIPYTPAQQIAYVSPTGNDERFLSLQDLQSSASPH